MAPALLWGHADAGRPVSGTEYHSRAAMTMTIWWILSDMPVSPDFITDMITKMRDAGPSHMLCQRDGSSPYTAKAEGA